MTNYSWDSAIPESTESHDYPVAAAGTYAFEVLKAEKLTYTPRSVTSKIPTGTPQIKLMLRVEGKDETGKDVEVNVFENLYATENMVWKATEFAKAIGIYHQGISFVEVADKCVGEIGTAEINVREYNGTKSNQVKKFVVKPQINSAEDLPF